MGSLEASERVVIIGAGPGGLALAQILRRNNVPFEIFERITEYSGKRQGWTVGLIESLPIIKNLLPVDLGDIHCCSVNHEVGEYDLVGILDGKTGALKVRIGGANAAGDGPYYLRANRERLRKFLSKNIDISLAKQFVGSSQDDQGVTAHFSDGTSCRGKLLVGADGPFSAVRHQLLEKDQGPSLSPNIPINGVCRLSQAEYEPLRKLSNAFLFTALEGVFLNIGLISISRDQSSAVYYWGVAILSDDPKQSSEWVQQADSETLYNKCLDLTKHLPDWLTNIIRKTGPEGMVDPQIRFYEYLLPEDVPTDKRTVLMGDAAHTMIPFKGAGANTAITDACELGQLIVESWNGSCKESLVDVDSMIRQYNQVMIPRGRQVVLQSRAAGQTDGGITAITEGRAHTLIPEKQTRADS